MTHSKHSLNQNNKKSMKSPWFQKEGVFKTPQEKWIARIKIKNTNIFTTISSHNTEEEALVEYSKHKDLALTPNK